MPLTLNKVPGEIALSRNQMIIEITAKDANGNPYGPTGASSTWELNGGAITAGETVDLSYTDADGVTTTEQFLAAVSPVGDNQIPAYVSGVITDHYTAVLQKIALHPNLQPFLNFTSSYGLTFELKATAISTEASIVVSWDASAVANTVTTTDAGAGSSTAPVDYKVKLDIFFEEEYLSGNYAVKVSTESGHDENGKVRFNVSRLLESELMNIIDFNIPAFDDDAAYVFNPVRRYYFRFSESGEDITPEWFTQSERLVMCGGIPANIFADNDFFTSLDATNSLLTWYPDGKWVSLDQPEWIGWFNYTEADVDARIKLTTIDYDGAEVTTFLFTNYNVVVPPSQVGLFPVSPTALGLGTDIAQYKITVQEFTGAEILEDRSQVRTYNVDRRHYNQKRYLMYSNGFCLPMTLRCTGQHTTELEVDRMETEHVLAPGYDALFSEVRQHGQQHINYFTYRTGYLSEPEMHALQELLIYGDVYEVYSEGYIPLRLKDKKFFIVSSREHLRSYALVASPRLSPGNYGNINIPLTPEQNDWATSYGDFWKTVYGTNWKIA